MFKQILISAALACSSALAVGFEKIDNFGNNPSGAEMYVYLPEQLPAAPAVLVAVHWCTGTAPAFKNSTQYSNLADKYGFIIIYPDAPDAGGCWDVSSYNTLHHDKGGDSLAIANMVRYALSTYKADASRVFVTGVSSGGMMTNVLLATYPELFAAGSAFAGVPYSCFEGKTLWNEACALGKVERSPKRWGDKVRSAYPEYQGPRPRMQLWHGSMDFVVNYRNFGEAIKQWTNVFGLSQEPTQTIANPLGQEGWVRTQYANPDGVVMVDAIYEVGREHGLAIYEEEALKFFGLMPQ